MKFIAPLIVAGVLIFGCAKAPNMVGTWESNMGGAHSLYHFRKDNTYTMATDFDGVHAQSDGTYSVEGGHLAMQQSSMKVLGEGPRADTLRQEGNQSSARMTMRWDTPMSFSLIVGNDPPLQVHRISPQP